MAWQKAIAQTVSVTFYAAGEPTAPTGALTATISKDGAAFGAIGGSIAQIGVTACALLTLNTADTNCDTGVVKIVDAAGTADDRYVEFTTEASWTAAKAALIETMRGTDNAALASIWTSTVANRIDENVSAAKTLATGAVTAAVVATGAIDADALAADAAAEIADAVFDEAMSGHVAAGSFGRYMRDVFSRVGLGIVADESAGTIKVYDGNDPATASLLFTFTRTTAGDTHTYVRS